jgi:radical SAM superfamily enzyme YgiQ (UPF0313 family)
MKVVLIVPGSKAGVTNPRYRELFPHLLPMSIAYLGAVLEKTGAKVLLIDQIARRMTNADLAAFLKHEAPDVIGFSLLTTTVSNVLAAVALIRKEVPKARIVMGNHHASLFAEDLLKNHAADIIVRGEGEATLVELVEALGEGRSLAGIKGISYRKGKQVVHNPPRAVIPDLDSLPYPAWHLVDLFDRKYMELPLIGVYSTPLPVMASRGCPFHCVFCSQDTQYKKVRLRQAVKVVDEVEYHVERYGFEWFGFNDAYFPWTKKQGFEFADELIRRGLNQKVRWITESRVDMVDDELMMRLAESGLSVIFFGFESGNQQVLDRCGKRTTLEQARRAARAARKAGVIVVGFFMLGLPGDTAATCRQTVDFAIELDCDFAKFAVTVPYPGSPLYEQQKHRIDTSQFEKFTSWYNWASGDEELLSAPEGMTVEELLAIQREGMLKFYARPSQVLRHLRRGTLSPKHMAYGAYVLTEGVVRNVARRLGR